MREIRCLARLVAIVGITFAVWIVSMLGLPFAWIARRTIEWRSWMTRVWARSLVGVLGMRVVVEGEPPSGAFLLVSNHLSYVDVLLLASRVRAFFVAKAEVREWPLIGPAIASMGTLFIDRRRGRDLLRVGEDIRATLARGQGVVLFPEGTSTPGAEVAAFRSSLLDPAARLGLPVRHAAIRYSTPPGEAPAHQAVSWWGDATLGPHLFDLLRLPGFEACLVFGEEPICDSDRKALAAKLHAAVSEHFVPMLTRTT